MKKMFMTVATFLAFKGLTTETFDSMEATKRAELLNEQAKMNDEYFKEIESSIEGKVSKEDFEALKTANEAIKNEAIRLAELISKNSEKPSKQGFATMKEAIENALEGVKDEINKAINGKQESAIKAVVTMQVDNTIGAGATQVTITENTGIITAYRKRELRYLANVSVGRTSGNRALWMEQTAEDGTPIMLGEGDAKTQLSAIWQEKTAEVKKIAVFGKVSTELMADIPQLVSYIQNNLMKRLDIVLENQLIGGNNTGDNLNGATNLATAFSAGTLANTITTPNDYDVIQAVALQTELAFGVPNGIFVNPAVIARMKLTKGSDGHYVMPTFATVNGLEVGGMRVIPTTAMSGENFLGGDLTVLNVLIREELGIQIGLDGNDFTNNKKTMLIEKRLVQFASANDVACLIKGAFNTAKALLATT